MTAREVRAAFEKNRIREEDIEGIMLLLFWSIPRVIEGHPEWLDRLFTPKTVCDFQMEVIKHAVQDQTMLRLIFDNSERLRTMFGEALRAGSFLEAGTITLAAQRRSRHYLTAKCFLSWISGRQRTGIYRPKSKMHALNVRQSPGS